MIAAATLIAAMSVGIAAAPPPLDCAYVTPMIQRDTTTLILAGNYPDGKGGCVIWLNRETFQWYDTREDACKLAMHEAGHLAGLMHSPNPADLMYAPYRPKPYPAACARLAPKPKTPHKRHTRRRK